MLKSVIKSNQFYFFLVLVYTGHFFFAKWCELPFIWFWVEKSSKIWMMFAFLISSFFLNPRPNRLYTCINTGIFWIRASFRPRYYANQFDFAIFRIFTCQWTTLITMASVFPEPTSPSTNHLRCYGVNEFISFVAIFLICDRKNCRMKCIFVLTCSPRVTYFKTINIQLYDTCFMNYNFLPQPENMHGVPSWICSSAFESVIDWMDLVKFSGSSSSKRAKSNSWICEI